MLANNYGNGRRNNLDDFGDNASERLQFENELLKLKLQAECGNSQFYSNAPLSIENEFLKHILSFERAMAEQKEVS